MIVGKLPIFFLLSVKYNKIKFDMVNYKCTLRLVVAIATDIIRYNKV